MTKIQLIYDICASWEKDYIKELFNIIDLDIIYVTPEILKTKIENEEQFINNNILVFSSNVYTYNEILNIVLRIKPLIIVHLSDEYGTRSEYTSLASHTKLLLHQHHFNNYPYNDYKNVIQIPLGYMSNMFNNGSMNINLKPLSQRKYKWSFVGDINKSDRLELVNTFQKKINDNIVINNIKPESMFDIYNNSIFVPNGRGNVRLDCFRIYEAILSGSIPIIVCNDHSEFNDTFYFNNDIPPFIFEKTWNDAVDKCEYLLNNIKELEIIQEKNYKWLHNKIKTIQEIILNLIYQ